MKAPMELRLLGLAGIELVLDNESFKGLFYMDGRFAVYSEHLLVEMDT